MTAQLLTEFTGDKHLPQNTWYVRQDVMLEFSMEWEKEYGWKNGTGYRKNFEIIFFFETSKILKKLDLEKTSNFLCNV